MEGAWLNVLRGKMEIYLVGGAVRDQILGVTAKEKDWVVTGATVSELIALGFQQVGKNFPVFLHPNTREEYALARRERKVGPGYYGFRCEFGPEVTLLEDLSRRDLTINAMAIDSAGHLIDPYGGKKDIENKWLRHVSCAFIEDPVRVLRVARFAARFHVFGFRIAPETRRLMYHLVRNNELDYLVRERIWQEWEKSLTEKNPEQFVLVLRSCGALFKISPELDDLFGIPDYSSTGDVGVDSLHTFIHACAFTQDPLIRFAVLMHDLGKLSTPIAEWPYHRNAMDAASQWIDLLCERLRVPKEYRQLALLTAKYAKKMDQILMLAPEEILEIIERTGAFRLGPVFSRWLTASYVITKNQDHTNMHRWELLKNHCLQIDSADLPKGSGEIIKNFIKNKRLEIITCALTQWKSE